MRPPDGASAPDAPPVLALTPPVGGAPRPGSPVAGRTVLVVDDSVEDAEVVRRYLRRATSGLAAEQAYAVRHVPLAADALAAVRDAAHRPDMVLLDHGLPDMSGLELLEVLAAEPGGSPVPVIMLTGSHVHMETAVGAMRRGALDYLAKDQLTPDALRRAVDGALARFESARLLAAQRDELERRNRALDAATARTSRLLAVVTALGGAVTPEEVAEATLREVMAATGATVGVVAMTRAPAGASGAAAAYPVLELVRTVGLPESVQRAWARVPLSTDVPLTAVVRTGEPVWATDTAAATARFPHLARVRAEAGYEGAATLPLLVDGHAVGALALAFPGPRTFPREERAFLMTVARQCAQAVERARLYAAEHAARGEAEAARAEAERANQTKAQFLAAMSHELRTPLNAIGGYAELMALGIRGPVTPEQVEDLGRIRRAGQHLQSLINDILNYARIEAGRVRYDVQDVPVAALVADVEALVAPQLRARGLAFAAEVGGDAVAVRADPERTRQVLLNLLTNAVKFTEPGGRVSVACVADAEAGVVRIAVADTGRGIPAAELAQVFEPFVQVDRHRTPEGQQGVGLGLAISRDLARGMGGDLTAESAPGAGSTFTLALPAA